MFKSGNADKTGFSGGIAMADMIIPKSQMTEEDIKLNYITPALLDKGWKNKITMETSVNFTAPNFTVKTSIFKNSI